MINIDFKDIIKYGRSIITWIFKPENLKFLLLIIVLGLLYFLYTQHQTIEELKGQNQLSRSNQSALESSLQVVTDELGNVIGENGALQVELDQLTTLRRSLADEVRKLRENVVIATQIETVVIRDTIVDIPTAGEYLGFSRFRLQWEYDDSGEWGRRLIVGASEFDIIGREFLQEIQTTLIKDEFVLNIITGFRETEDGLLRTFARTTYPGATFNQVDGAILDPRFFVTSQTHTPNRWVIGPQFGMSMSGEYVLRPTIGFGVTYNMWSF